MSRFARASSSRLRIPVPNPDLARLPVYQPGRAAPAGAVKLASNENPYGPSSAALLAIRRFCAVERYPDGSGSSLRRALGRSLGLRPESILLGAGSDEIGDFIAHAYLQRGDSVVYPRHTFIRYPMLAQSVGARRIVSDVRPDFSVDVPDLLRAIRTARPKLVCLANPNNPTGACVNRKDLLSILERTPGRTLIVLDEAYFEYARLSPGHPDGIRWIRRFPNLLVLRTFSKIYALASLRVGYAAAHPAIVSELNKVRPPFNVSAVALAAAEASLSDAAHVRRCAAKNASERDRLSSRLAALGVQVFPSPGNFLMIDRLPGRLDGPTCFRDLASRGVIIRDLIPYGLRDHIRVTVGTPAENDRFLRAMRDLS